MSSRRAYPLITRLHLRVQREAQARRLAAALVASRGNVRAACALLGLRSRASAYNVAREFPQLLGLFRGYRPWAPRPCEIPDSRPELVALAAAEIRRCGGQLTSVRHALDLQGTRVVHDYLNRYPELWGVVDEARRQARLRRWLVVSVGALENRRMLEQAVAAIEGLELEEVVAEVEASAVAGLVDAQALAEALVAARDAGG